jgi:hypothetical protein
LQPSSPRQAFGEIPQLSLIRALLRSGRQNFLLLHHDGRIGRS